MTDRDPLPGRFKPGSKRERLWQVFWKRRREIVPLPELRALVMPVKYPQSALSRQVKIIRGHLRRTQTRWAPTRWSLTNISGVGYGLEEIRR